MSNTYGTILFGLFAALVGFAVGYGLNRDWYEAHIERGRAIYINDIEYRCKR